MSITLEGVGVSYSLHYKVKPCIVAWVYVEVCVILIYIPSICEARDPQIGIFPLKGIAQLFIIHMKIASLLQRATIIMMTAWGLA